MNKYIYVIALHSNKYYIGSAYNISLTLKTIFKRNLLIKNKNDNNKILLEFKPFYLDFLICNCSDLDKNNIIRLYMRKYGVKNVYGDHIDSFLIEQESILEINKKYNIK